MEERFRPARLQRAAAARQRDRDGRLGAAGKQRLLCEVLQGDEELTSRHPTAAVAMDLIHTCYRITDPEKSVAFYEALGFEKRAELPIRDEAVNIFMGLP